MCEASFHAVVPVAFTSAGMAPVVGFDYPAFQYCLLGSDVLPGNGEAEFIEATEGGEVRGVEGNLGHVEVFLMGSVVTSILKDLDLLCV